jgi:cytochrome c-type biogenesis protein CcmF
MFLFNNVILIGMAFTIFMLTVFPIISEWFTGRQTTIGPPVYNQVNVPWGLVLLLLAGICPLIAWKRTSFANIRKNFLIPAIISVLFAVFLFIMGVRKIYPLAAFGFSLFVFLTIFIEFFKGTRSRQQSNQENLFLAFFRLISRNKRRYGGYIIHIGVVLIFIGITGSSAYQFEKEQTMRLREGMEIGSYFVTFDSYKEKRYPERFNITFHFHILNSGKNVGSLLAELNNYPRFGLSTEVGIKRNFLTGIFSDFKRLGEDLYIIPMGFDPQTKTVSIKVYINPMINWLWIGGIIFIIGSFIATLPEREERERIKQPLSSENDKRLF